MMCCSVRSTRQRELDSSASQSVRVVASSTQSVPQRQFCTSVQWPDVKPASAVTRDVDRSMHRYTGGEYTAGGDQQIAGNGQTVQPCRTFTGTDSIGMVARLSDDDYHSPDSAYHSSHGSGNSTAWNGGQAGDDQLSRQHRWWPRVTQVPTNHEKSPSWPVTRPSVLPPGVGHRTSSWTDNTRTNVAEFCEQNPVPVGSQVEDGSPPSPHSARRYFEEIAAQRLSEQQFRSELRSRNTAFHPSSYAVNSPYRKFDSIPSAENTSTNCVLSDHGKVVASRSKSFRNPVGQDCSPGPPPLPATSPPHDPPPRLASSGTRTASSSDMDRLVSPYNATLHRDIVGNEVDRHSLMPNGQGVLGMQVSPSVSRVESLSETSIKTVQPQREQSFLANGRRHAHEYHSGNVAPVAEGTQVGDNLSLHITSTDEDDLHPRLDKLPACQSQTSMLRRLSQEYYGASRSCYGINPAGRMSLGSLSSSLSTSGNDLSQPPAVKNVDTHYRHLELESPTGAPGSSVTGVAGPLDDAGTSFVRTRKTQMSLRKAFGIFDDFDVAETELIKQLPVLTEDELPNAAVPPSMLNDSVGLSAIDDHRFKGSKGRRSSESEFHRQAGDWQHLDRQVERPAVNPSLAMMQRSMSLGSAGQTMTSAVLHGHRLSTASDAQSSNSSSSGSSNGVRSSLDLSTGSSARSGEVLVPKQSSDPMKMAKAKSKSLPRDVLLSSDPGPAMSFQQPWRQSEDTMRPQVDVYLLKSESPMDWFYASFNVRCWRHWLSDYLSVLASVDLLMHRESLRT